MIVGAVGADPGGLADPARSPALLLYPYLGWLMFAAMLNYQIAALNPNAETLAPRAATTDIPL